MPEPAEKISFNKKSMISNKNCTSLINSLENTNQIKNSFKITEGQYSKKAKINEIDCRTKAKLDSQGKTEARTPQRKLAKADQVGREVTEATTLQECSTLANQGTPKNVPQEEYRVAEADTGHADKRRHFGRQVAEVGMHVSCESVFTQGGDKWLK